MDASTSSLLRVPHSSSAAFPPRAPGDRMLTPRPRRVRVGGGGFVDEGHLRYYASTGKAKEGKTRRKLEENLSRDLSALIGMGFGLEERTAADQDGGGPKRMSISEAAELLLVQLEQVRAKEKDMKTMKKKDRKSMNRMKDCDESSSSSSSESSESSDSDCEEEVVNMSTLRATPAVATPVDPAMTTTSVPKTGELQIPEETILKSIEVPFSSTCATECTCTSAIDKTVGLNINSMLDATRLPTPPPSLSAVAVTGNRIEVCMGGKCKKSGGLQLMEEFDRHVGAEGMVVGCKCLGKCKEGPNVRIVNHNMDEEAPVMKQRNPLCIGVGLEDVRAIVSNYFGERSLGLQSC